ncbi:Ubiquitin carboxyl-terminal hydrolase isozyme L5 [Sarcoptes scabiei]|uniref:Ubiquitin carboxyl-terminal hydrolase n=1 Tax=Sarcoptes scabiei TaxID=52283 RepID=A0A132A790_SARSC|nr:Ubiquitin carboxyl-terminal hydrolase isozyme L5 [Sarcoptes scabiei]KPM06280.1 ubiquitin carboxyl-terminal hydrolase isozyme L5-like protein [Sarcoptes scabiei]
MSTDQWCLIESDPGVFSELIKGFGVSGVQVEELYSLMPECFDNLKPVHGLIFLFKWVPDDYSDGHLLQDDFLLDQIFFAKQVIQNACATQALINILMNCNHPDLNLGETLMEFKEFSRSFDASMKGLTLSNCELIRKVHNSFARQQFFEYDGMQNKKEKEDVFHFIGYIPFGGRLLELDGLKEGPYDLGPVGPNDDWIAIARPHIEKRMQKYTVGEIHFNLMAIISERKMLYERKIAEMERLNTDEARLQIESYYLLIKQEIEKMDRYKNENIRRKHNYLPMIVEILKQLAHDGRLIEVYEKAKQKSIEFKQKQQRLEKSRASEPVN